MPDTPRIHPLLDGVVDYAGLFPPARLSLPDAVDEYAGHARGDDAAMLGRFICPVERLDELRPFADRFDAGLPLRLSLLVRPGGSDRLGWAVTAASAFTRRFEAPSRVEIVESLAPDMPSGAAVRSALCDAADRVAPLPLFLEVPVARRPDDALRVLGEFGPARRAGRTNLGAKIRCGGAEAADYPPSDAVAAFVHRCVMDGVPFKATAGLHHPVRGTPSDEGPPMHGFLNVFGAAVLGATLGLGPDTLRRIVDETDPGAFSLEDGRFTWQDLTAPLPAVQAVRSALAVGFGSCSFDEPTGDLHALGWLRAYS